MKREQLILDTLRVQVDIALASIDKGDIALAKGALEIVRNALADVTAHPEHLTEEPP